MKDRPPRAFPFRRLLVYTAGALLLLVALLAVGSWLAMQAWGPLLARDRVAAALSSALGRPVRVGEVAIEIWRGPACERFAMQWSGARGDLWRTGTFGLGPR